MGLLKGLLTGARSCSRFFMARGRSAVLGTLLVSVVVLAAIPATPVRGASAPSEYQLKAVFLFNFAQFVEWPETAFGDASTPLVIGVVGADPFGPYLDDVVRGEQVKGRPLVVKRYRKVEEAADCHILFLGAGEAGRSVELPASLAERHVLTVADSSRVARPGTIIQFVDATSRIRLRIDIGSAHASGLTISSKLLRAAEIVGERETGP